MQYLSGILVVISLVGGFYFGVKAITNPDSISVYNATGISHHGIQVWGTYLVLSTVLLLFPKTFVLANGMMLVNGLYTIVCFLIIKDFKGAGIEVINAIVPVTLLLVGYPKNVLNWMLNHW